jgi:hypothetical protein
MTDGKQGSGEAGKSGTILSGVKMRSSGVRVLTVLLGLTSPLPCFPASITRIVPIHTASS